MIDYVLLYGKLMHLRTIIGESNNYTDVYGANRNRIDGWLAAARVGDNNHSWSLIMKECNEIYSLDWQTKTKFIKK